MKECGEYYGTLKANKKDDEYIETYYTPEDSQEEGYVKMRRLSDRTVVERRLTSFDGVPASYFVHTKTGLRRICGEDTVPETRLVILGQLYGVPGACEVEGNAVSIDWGNGILYDEDKTWADYMGMVSAGMLKPEIALGWRFGMPVETETDLAAIRAKYMPTLNQLADGDGWEITAHAAELGRSTADMPRFPLF